jgi:hypothetical protein
MKNNNYKIVRYFQNAEIDSQVMYTGLTLEEAIDHLALPYTKEPGVWFDSYTKEITHTSYSSLAERFDNGVKSEAQEFFEKAAREVGYTRLK